MKNFYQEIIEANPQAIAIYRLILDQDQNPVDFQFLDINKAFESLTGLTSSEVIGKSTKDILNELSTKSVFFERCVEVGLSGPRQSFEWYSQLLKRTFKVDAFSLEPMIFATIFTDISEEVHNTKIKDIVMYSNNDIVFEFDEELNFLTVFNQDETHLFLPRNEFINKNLNSIFPKEFLTDLLPVFEKAKQSGIRQSFIYPSFRKDDSRWYRAVIVYTCIDNENRYILSVIDFTDHKKATNALNETSQRYQQLAHHTRTIVWELDQEGRFTYLSETVETVLGYKPNELIGKAYFYDLHPYPTRETIKDRGLKIFLEKSKMIDFKHNLISKNGEVLNFSTSGFPILNPDGSLKGYRGSDVDITDLKRIDEALILSEKKFQFITENISDVIWVLNTKTMRFTYFSPSVFNLRGYTAEEELTHSIDQMVSSITAKELKHKVEKTVKQFLNQSHREMTQVEEIQIRHKNGTSLWVEVSMKFRFGESGFVEIIGISRNIDQRKQAEKEILYLSYRDALTGIYNRSYYEEEINRMNTQRNLPFTLVVCDINGLKLTNDAFGHMAGDRMIKALAEILKEVCRKDDIIARIGGDEFAILLPKTTEDVATVLVSRIQNAIALSKPDKIKLSVAMGIKTKLTLEEDFSEIFKQAEDRMYSEKVKNQSNIKTNMLSLITSSLFEKYPDENQHAHNVSNLCRKIGETLKMSQEVISDLELAGLLHDIGKIGLDEDLITKKNDAFFDETPEFKRHSEIGYQIARSIFEFSQVAEFILAHHEWFNGEGYPKGLKGEEIPLQARIIKIINDFSSQIDREGQSIPETLNFIRRRSGVQYDPELVDLLEKLFSPIPNAY